VARGSKGLVLVAQLVDGLVQDLQVLTTGYRCCGLA
jgi:hypothetical protein